MRRARGEQLSEGMERNANQVQQKQQESQGLHRNTKQTKNARGRPCVCINFQAKEVAHPKATVPMLGTDAERNTVMRSERAASVSAASPASLATASSASTTLGP